jgi:hypothetical protein
MSELEKIRAVSFLSILTIMLVVLFALQSRTPHAPEPKRNAIELCAVSKGALCDDPAAHAQVAVVGSMTVVADRLPGTRMTELEASTEAALHLAEMREAAELRNAQTLNF